MSSRKLRMIAGLDVGKSTTKLVVLRQHSDGSIQCVHTNRFDHRAEGILSDAELPAPLGEWIQSTGYGNVPTIIGIPQHTSILQVSDFPPGDGKQLEEMVDYETRQLGGLSDDDFLYDHTPLGPFHVYGNPVLIGICREGVVTDRLEWLAPTETSVADVALEGAALATAVQYLNSRKVVMPRQLHMILDLGTDGGTVLLQTEGKIVFSASIPIGGDTFTTALSSAAQLTEGQAEKQKRELILDPDAPGPLSGVASQLIRETQQAIEHWRFQREENDLPISRVMLTGGAAELRGLDVFIERHLNCRAERLNMPDVPEDQDSCSFLTAWGLALHGFGDQKAGYRLSLAPPALRYKQQRLARFPFLIGAAALLALAFSLGLGVSFYDLKRQISKFEVRRNSLQECADLSPKVLESRNETRNIEEMLIPFAVFGNRNRDFLAAMQTLGPHQQTGDWLAYLADEPSYFAPDVDYKPIAPSTTAPAPSIPLLGLPGAPGASTGPAHVQTTAISPSRFFIASGFTPRFKTEPLRNVRKTVDSINALTETPFTEVSVLPDVERQVWVAIQPWVSEFQMKGFFLMLPNRQPPYAPEAFE